MSRNLHLLKKWHLVVNILPILAVLFILKIILHTYGLEYISLNALFTSLIAATTFLIGFLITGVISDYKESEKLPGELSVSLGSIYNEAYILNKNKSTKQTKEFISYYADFIKSVNNWFYKKEKTKNLIAKLDEMNDYFAEFESIMQAGFLSRMKSEQTSIYRLIIRIDYIRGNSFIPSAYAIVESLALVIIVGLLFLRLEPFYEAVFFTLIVSFLIIYMILLLKDLDNPFDYSRRGWNSTEVSLKPVHDLAEKILSRELK